MRYCAGTSRSVRIPKICCGVRLITRRLSRRQDGSRSRSLSVPWSSPTLLADRSSASRAAPTGGPSVFSSMRAYIHDGSSTLHTSPRFSWTAPAVRQATYSYPVMLSTRGRRTLSYVSLCNGLQPPADPALTDSLPGRIQRRPPDGLRQAPNTPSRRLYSDGRIVGRFIHRAGGQVLKKPCKGLPARADPATDPNELKVDLFSAWPADPVQHPPKDRGFVGLFAANSGYGVGGIADAEQGFLCHVNWHRSRLQDQTAFDYDRDCCDLRNRTELRAALYELRALSSR